MDLIREAAKDSGFEWARILPESALVKQPGLRTQIQSVVEEVYRPLFEIQAKPMPGMRRVVENLVAAGIKLGIVTSTPREHIDFKLKKLKQNDSLRQFGAIVTTSDVARQKPAPEPMIECCRQLDVKLENSVYIGDSRSDIQSGRTAGMKTIAVLSGFDELDALIREFPDAVLNSVADLGSIIN
jgi:HAD superfamily hydrolase (TIGR01662 family)